MTQGDKDRRAYELGENYLLALHGVTVPMLAHYRKAPDPPPDLRGIYRRLLLSAQNRNMAAGVIGGSIGDIDKPASENFDEFAKVTFNFDPVLVRQHYQQRHDQLLDDIVDKLHPRGKVRRVPNGIWPVFCRSALSGAELLADAGSAQKFYDSFPRPRMPSSGSDCAGDGRLLESPRLLSKQVFGFGLALACDFLKELGYYELPKPDVFICKIIPGLGLSEPKADDEAVCNAVVRIACHRGTTPYDVDKTFWLVGSGFFYDHPEVGKKGRVPTDYDAFIRWARPQLE
jgi:hypothetical protein